jgi:hypothetical protein
MTVTKQAQCFYEFGLYRYQFSASVREFSNETAAQPAELVKELASSPTLKQRMSELLRSVLIREDRRIVKDKSQSSPSRGAATPSIDVETSPPGCIGPHQTLT